MQETPIPTMVLCPQTDPEQVSWTSVSYQCANKWAATKRTIKSLLILAHKLSLRLPIMVWQDRRARTSTHKIKAIKRMVTTKDSMVA